MALDVDTFPTNGTELEKLDWLLDRAVLSAEKCRQTFNKANDAAVEAQELADKCWVTLSRSIMVLDKIMNRRDEVLNTTTNNKGE